MTAPGIQVQIAAARLQRTLLERDNEPVPKWIEELANVPLSSTQSTDDSVQVVQRDTVSSSTARGNGHVSYRKSLKNARGGWRRVAGARSGKASTKPNRV